MAPKSSHANRPSSDSRSRAVTVQKPGSRAIKVPEQMPSAVEPAVERDGTLLLPEEPKRAIQPAAKSPRAILPASDDDSSLRESS